MPQSEQQATRDCQHFNTTFCSGLSAHTKNQLCAVCHIKQYAKGQILRERYWANSVSLMLKGLIAATEDQGINKRPLVLGIVSAGDFFGLEAVFTQPEQHGTSDFKDTYCLADCTVAVFDASTFKSLMDHNMDLTQHVLKICLQSGWQERTNMLRSLGYGSAEESVRYVLDYLRRHRIDYLTHEQIAFICNRSRQTVTSIMKTITEQEPELFII